MNTSKSLHDLLTDFGSKVYRLAVENKGFDTNYPVVAETEAAIVEAVEGLKGGCEKPKDSSEPVTTKSVTLVSAYDPITVYDQYGNPYICLNQYEARSIAELLGKLDAQGHGKFNTGDWWIDLPTKIIKWLRRLEKRNDLVATDKEARNG